MEPEAKTRKNDDSEPSKQKFFSGLSARYDVKERNKNI